MRRQPTLAEILSDDTGKIRAEIADLLMDPNAQSIGQTVRQPMPQPRQQPRSVKIRWIFLGLAILIIIIVLRSLNIFKPSRQDFSEILETKHAPSFVSATPAPIKPPTRTETEVLKKGAVIGNNVLIRAEPNQSGDIIQEANQDDIFNIISFHDGWYEIELPNQNHGYIFGAYLLAQNFDSHPYRAAVNKDMTKLLVKDEGSPEHYTIIFPSGQTTLIRKEDVEIYQ
jgi:hypothetical protein